MTGTQISAMTPEEALPAGAVVPFVVPSATPGFDPLENYIYDLGGDLLTRVSYAALALSGAAASVGSEDGNVQADINARPTAAVLASPTGAEMVGTQFGTLDTLLSVSTLVTRGGATGDTGGVRQNLAIGIDTLEDNDFELDEFPAGGGIFYNGGDFNLALGNYALQNNTNGRRNTAIGIFAGQANTTGAYNTFIAPYAGFNNTTGEENTYVGVQAGQFGTTANFNTGVGVAALNHITTGQFNCGFGHLALNNVTTSNGNTGVGRQAGLNITTGAENTIVGFQAGSALTTPSWNCVFGAAALGSCVIGTENSVFGRRSFLTATGDQNTGFGADTGVSVTTGARNTFIGYNAGSSTTIGNNNICIGNGAVASSASTGDEATIGNASVNTLRLGGGQFFVSETDFRLSKTRTAGGTTGAQVINKPAGSVNFAAGATSLVVSNALVTTNSIVLVTINTNDTTLFRISAVAGAGTITLNGNAAATAETRVSFLVIN